MRRRWKEILAMRLKSISALWFPGATVILILGLMACGGETATEDTPVPEVDVEAINPPPPTAEPVVQEPLEPTTQPATTAPTEPVSPPPETAPSEPATTQPTAQVIEEPAPVQTTPEQLMRLAGEVANDVCPITGEDVNPDVFVEIDGQRIHFATVEAQEEFLNQMGKDD
jgi:outer membrane biosynthesis protein TonB